VFNASVKRHGLGLATGLGCLAWGCLALGAAVAQEMHHPPGHAEDGDPAVAAYVTASERMHQAMAIEFTGNADIDFARAMIAHHQGAIDMARAVLEYGQEPEIRGLAEAIIAAQENEIAVLRGWLEEHGQTAD